MWTPDQVEHALEKYGEFAPTLPNFLHLYSDDRELFFQLACVGIDTSAPCWMRDASIMAAYLRALAYGFWLEGEGEAGDISTVFDNLPRLYFRGLPLETVRTFMRSLEGFPTDLDGPERPGDRMQGRSVTEAHLAYHLGIEADGVRGDKREAYLTRQRELSST